MTLYQHKRIMRLRVSPANQPANTIATEENWNIQQSRKSCDDIVLCARQIDYEGGSCRERSKWAEWLRAFRVVSACEHKQQNRMYDDQKCTNTERKPQRRQITHNWMSLGDEIMDKKKAFLYPWIHIGIWIYHSEDYDHDDIIYM